MKSFHLKFNYIWKLAKNRFYSSMLIFSTKIISQNFRVAFVPFYKKKDTYEILKRCTRNRFKIFFECENQVESNKIRFLMKFMKNHLLVFKRDMFLFMNFVVIFSKASLA